MPKFWTKSTLFGYFWAGIWKPYCHIWNQYPWIFLIAKYPEIMKMPKFGTKSALFGYFWAGIWKPYCHVWSQHRICRICLIAKFCRKTKMPIFGSKNALLGYFWPKMPYFGIFGQEFQKYCCHIWNKHPQICLVEKFCEKNKKSKFGTQNVLFGYFWGRILKNYCHIWNQHPQLCRKWPFNSYSKFWYRVRFF